MRKKLVKRTLSALLVMVLLLSAAPLNGFVGLDLFGTMASAASYNVGDIVEFGSYPQSEVKDSATLAALNGKTLNWISYGYYSGNGNYGSMVQGDWMKYADVTHNGNKYRAVRFTQYRPYWTEDSSSAGNSHQDDNGYSTNTTYWFKYEPLRWRVLDPSTGLVLSETCVDSQAYSNTIYSYDGYYWNDAAHTHYANDYVTSSIREWLNDDFYNTAFNSAQQGAIVLTTLDNSAYSSSYSQYDSASTTDKVFLMSYEEIRNPAYGFSNSASTYDVARRAKSTDYAKAQGCYQNTSSSYQGNAHWFLRSPGGSSSDACKVYGDGELDYNYSFYVLNTYFGVRPALRLNLTSVIPTSPDGEVEVFSENKYIADIWLSLRGGEDTLEWDLIRSIVDNGAMQSEAYYNAGNESNLFKGSLVAKRTLDFAANPVAGLSELDTTKVYESLILDLLSRVMLERADEYGCALENAVETAGVVDDTVGAISKYKGYIDDFMSVTQGSTNLLLNELYRSNYNVTSTSYQNLLKSLNNTKDTSAWWNDSEFMKGVGYIQQAAGLTSDYIKKVASYLVVYNTALEMRLLLDEMYTFAAGNPTFQNALSNVKESIGNIDYAQLVCGANFATDAMNVVIKKVFSIGMKAIPVYGQIAAVYEIGNTIVNLATNIDGSIDGFLLCKAMSEVSSANKLAIKSLAAKYRVTRSEKDAAAFLYAVRTFEQLYVLDYDTAASYLKEATEEGMIDRRSNQLAKDYLLEHYGIEYKTEYESYKETRDKHVEGIKNLFKLLNSYWIANDDYLKRDYPDIYDYYIEAELPNSVYTPFMHAYINTDGKTNIDWYVPSEVIVKGSNGQERSHSLWGSTVIDGIYYTERVGSSSKSYDKAKQNPIVLDNSSNFTTFKKYYTLKAYANTTNGRVYTPTASAELANPIAKPVLSMNKLVDPLSRPGDRINKISFEIEDISLQLYSGIKYTVERKEAGSSSWSLLKTVTRSPNPFRTTTTVFTDSTAQIGKTYDYRVKSSYTFGNGKTLTSPFSEVLTARIGDQTNLLKTHVRPYEGFRPQPMAMKSMAITTGAAPAQPYIEVSWDSTSGATGYEIYRIASYANSFVLIATVGGSTSSYNDYSVDSGVTYDYYVVPIKTTSGKNAYELGTYSHAEGAITADPVEITITYNANGGTVERSSDTISAGESITLPIPSRSGYTFSGWFTSSTGGTAVSSPYKPIDNATLYAHWVEQEESPDSIFEYKIKNGEAIITDCDQKASGEIRVPSFIEGYPVTEIDVQAFVFCDEITSLILPDRIRLIGSSALTNMEKLESITFSNSVQIIKADTFGCDSLTDIYFYGTRTDWEAIAISNRSDFEKLNVHFLLEDTSDENASITLDKTTVSMRYKDTPVQLHATLENVDSSQVVWASSRPSVAEVVDGKITSVGSGTTTIMAYVKGTNIQATCTVTVSYAWWQWIIKIVLFGWLWY